MIDARIEKQALTGMIVSTEFLQGIVPIYEDQLQIPFIRRIADWCIGYFNQYNQCPSKHIKDIFEKQKKKIQKEEEVFLTEEFLTRLSKRYETSNGFNVRYILDQVEEYFRMVSVEKLRDRLGTSLEKGNISRAENLIKTFERTARPETKGVNPFEISSIINAFSEESSDTLFRFPGVLGDVLGTFEREYLMAFFGIRGVGKTWWLLWTAMQAVMKGYNTVFVSLEMSEKQLVRRVHQMINSLPLKVKKDIGIQIPVFIEGKIKKGENITYFKDGKRNKQLSAKLAIEKINDIDESSLLKANLRMLFYPSRTKTVEDLKIQLQNMEHYEGFIPDVIVTDYADKFISDKKTEGRRLELEEVWNQHKAIAQERKCFVVTASQANTARTGKDIGVGSATESMAKEDLCDIILALNQKPEEKRQGIMRLGITKHRHDDYDILKEIYVTQCYDIGKPYIDSKIK